MGSPATEGIDLFKIANRSISGWIPSFKLSSTAAPVKLPFCSQLEGISPAFGEQRLLVAKGDKRTKSKEAK